jgi:hypothetical protein
VCVPFRDYRATEDTSLRRVRTISSLRMPIWLAAMWLWSL